LNFACIYLPMPTKPPLEMLKLICSLELSLLDSTVRGDKLQLSQLLHHEFTEIGRSGQRYDKAQIIALLLAETERCAVWSQDFELSMPAYSVALLTYKSARLDMDNALSLHAHRSSMWQFTEGLWQMRFHQATPCAPFAKNEAASAAALETH
jgi:hypothetical protein